MPIKNSSATKGAAYYIDKIQRALVQNGAVGIQSMFDDEGRITSLAFALKNPGTEQLMSFTLPCEWRKTQHVLKNEGHRRWDEDDFCYKVAWANLKDWVEAQMALYATEMVTIPQVFLPFAKTPSGKTLAEVISENPDKLLLE